MATRKFAITLDDVPSKIEEIILDLMETSGVEDEELGAVYTKGHRILGFDDWSFSEDGWEAAYHLGDPGGIYFYREKNCYIYLSEDEPYLDIFDKSLIDRLLRKKGKGR